MSIIYATNKSKKNITKLNNNIILANSYIIPKMEKSRKSGGLGVIALAGVEVTGGWRGMLG